MERKTQKDAVICAKRIANTLGKKFGNCWKRVDGKNVADIGCWNLDYNPTYGGAVIEEIMSEGGGVDNPLGMRKLKPSEFCSATQMAERAVMIEREKRNKR